MKKSVSTELTRANVAKVMELLADTPANLESLSKNISSEQHSRPLGSGERSFTEDLAHLIHCEARSSEAIYLALLAEEPLFLIFILNENGENSCGMTYWLFQIYWLISSSAVPFYCVFLLR